MLPPFESFWNAPTTEIPQDGQGVVMFSQFRADPEASPLPTASGKIEIYCERVAAYKIPDCPGYPVWIEPQEWLGAPTAEHYPLHLITDQPVKRVHSQPDHSPHSTRTTIKRTQERSDRKEWASKGKYRWS